MSTTFAQRVLALGAAALLGGVLAVAIQAHRGSAASTGLPVPVGAPGGDWYEALAGVAVGLPRRSACGYRISPKTLGVAEPVLPCGAQIYVAYGSKRALTQVVAHELSAPGRELELTPALARKLGLGGVRQVHWAYARD